MKMPFSTEQFLEVFMTYNLAIFPIQIVFYLISFFAIYLVIRPTNYSNTLISILLSFFWLWMGIVYHFIFFSTINKAAWLFGSLFILQGLFFLWTGVFRGKLSFKYRHDAYGIAGMIIIIFALVIYPILGYFLGHRYPYAPTFGLPCPTTMFTFGFLLLNTKKSPIALLIIPLLWSIIGFTAAFKLGIIEDTGMILTGIFSFSILLYRNRILTGKVILK